MNGIFTFDFSFRDIAFRFQEYNLNEFGVGVDENIRLVDINPAMLQVGRERAEKKGYHLMTFEEGNAQDLSSIKSINLSILITVYYC